MGTSFKLTTCVVLSYVLLIALNVFQFTYVNYQQDTILKLRQHIIDLEVYDKTDSIMKSIHPHSITDDTWIISDFEDEAQ